MEREGEDKGWGNEGNGMGKRERDEAGMGKGGNKGTGYGKGRRNGKQEREGKRGICFIAVAEGWTALCKCGAGPPAQFRT